MTEMNLDTPLPRGVLRYVNLLGTPYPIWGVRYGDVELRALEHHSEDQTITWQQSSDQFKFSHVNRSLAAGFLKPEDLAFFYDVWLNQVGSNQNMSIDSPSGQQAKAPWYKFPGGLLGFLGLSPKASKGHNPK
jgi:hypothetical protein